MTTKHNHQVSPTAGDCDVAIIGGGPAGAAAAIILQQHGRNCQIFENTRFPRYHIGESLIPHTYAMLGRLGLLPAMRASAYPVKHSVRFVAPSGGESDPFYFSETIEGERARTWQVERSTFDAMCIERARESGATIHIDSRVEHVLFDGERAVGVQVTGADRTTRQVRAKVVIDSSGRSSLIGRQLGLTEQVPGLNKASAWCYYKGARRRDGIDAGETTIFMLAGRNWFWYIPLPNDIVSVGFVGSPDELFAGSNDFELAFLDQVGRHTPLRPFLAGSERVAPVRGLRRLAYCNRQTVGDGWVMVGDAAAFLDPIYSSGLFLALGSAVMAADCAAEALAAGECSAERLGRFKPALTQGMRVIRKLIDAFYDPSFSFTEFSRHFPEHRAALIDCLVGDVVGKDMSAFLEALSRMTPTAAGV